MDENKQPAAAPETPKTPAVPAALETPDSTDQALFAAIGKGKRRRRVRRIVTTILILALVAGGIWAAVRYGKRKVAEQVGNMTATTTVNAYTVDTLHHWIQKYQKLTVYHMFL